MSTEVDKRVVEMQFKNEQFEQGAKTSIETVEKLKKSLDFNGAANGMKQLNVAAKGVNLDSLSASVDQISNRFSAMGIVAMTALQNITNSAINAGKQLLYSLTLEPVNQGFQEYELKMGSVQTIMAGTGESLESVTEQLDELNTYADKTIYSFSDMTSNIGKFTNAGVGLKDAVKAIQGISNEAAVSGANAQQASHAMYNFAQALSSGYVKLIDWKSIENANMATKEFKEQLIQTAIEVGTLTDAGDGMYATLEGHTLNATKDFNDSLKDQWMTTEVLVGTLSKYSDETTEIGQKAFAAAQDVKTFTQLMDTLKEAAGSGWAKTFEIIIGDFEEAKTLFTAVQKEFGGIIDRMSDARNRLLEGALGDSSKYAKQAYRDINDIMNNVKDGVLTSSDWEVIAETGMASKHFKQYLLDTAVAAGTLKKTEDGLYDTGKKLISVNSSNVEWNESLADGWLTSAVALDTLTETYKRNNVEIRATGRELLMQAFGNIWESIKTIAGSIKAAFTKIFPTFTSEKLYKIIEGFKNLTEALKPNPIVANNLARTFKGLFAAIDIIIQPLKFFANIIIELVKFFSPAAGGALELTAGIGDLLVKLDKAIKESGFFTDALQTLKDTFAPVGEAIKNVFGFIKDLIVALTDWRDGNKDLSESLEEVTKKSEGFAKAVEVLKNIAGAFYAVGSAIGGFFKKIWEGIKWLWNLPFVQTNVTRFGEAFKSVWQNIKDSMGPTTKAFEEFKKRLEALDGGITLENAWTVIKDFASNVATTFFSGIFNSLKPLGDAIFGFFSDLFGKISESLHKNDALKPFADFADKIRDFFQSLSGQTEAKEGVDNLKKFGDGLGEVGKVFQNAGEVLGPALEKVGGFIADHFQGILIGITGLTIFSAVKKLGRIGDGLTKGFQAIGKGLSAFGNILVEFEKLVQAGRKYIRAKTFETYINSIFKIILGLLMLIGAVAALTLVKQEKLWSATGVVAAVTGLLLLLVWGLSKILTSKAFANDDWATLKLLAMTMLIRSFATAVFEISIALRIIDGCENLLGDFLSIAGMIGVLLLTIYALTKITKGNDIKVGAISTILFAFGTSVLLLAAAFKVMDSVQNILQDMIAFGVMIAAMLVVIKVLAKNQSNAITATATIGTFGMAIMMLAMSFKIADGLTDVWKDLLVFAAMLTGLIVFVAAMSKLKDEATVSAGLLLSFASAILIISLAMAVLGFMNPEKMTQALMAIMTVMALLIAVMAVSKAAGEEAHKAGALLLGLGTSLLLISFAMLILGSMSTTGMKKALAAIIIIGMVFAGIIAISKIAGKEAHKAGLMLLAMSAALLVISGVVWILGNLDTGSLIKGVTAVSILMIVMGFLIAVGTRAKSGRKSIIAITVCLLLLGIMVAALAGIEPDRLAMATASLVSLMTVLTIFAYVSQYAGKVDVKSIFVMVGAMAALGILVAIISQFVEDGAKFLEISTGISEMAVALAAALAIIDKIGNVDLVLVAKATAAMDIIAGGIIALIAGVGAIFNAIDDFTGGGATDALNKGLEVMKTIADGIGEMIGSFIGSIGEGLTSHLPAIGDNLTAFAEHVKPFFDSISNIPDDVADRVSRLIGAVAVLTGSDFVYSLTQFFGGKSFEEFGSELSGFGSGLVAFLESINSLTDDDLSRIEIAAKAANLLSGAFANIPTEGGFLDFILGKSIGIDAFGEQAAKFGKMLKSFSGSVSELTEDDITAIENAAKATRSLVDVANAMPNSGGLLGKIVGENDMDEFGKKMVGFGVYLAAFSESISGFTETDAGKFEIVAQATQHLIDMSNTMENAGGLLGLLAGNNDLSELGTQLSDFGGGLSAFALSISTITDQDLARFALVAGCVEPLVKLSNTMENAGGFVSLWTGDNDLTTLGQQLVWFGLGLTSFGQSVDSLTETQIDKISLAATAAKPLVRLGNALHMENSGGFIALFTGDNGLDKLGDQLGKFGSGLCAFATNLGDSFDKNTATRVENAAKAAMKLVDLGNSKDSINKFFDIKVGSLKEKAELFCAGMNVFAENLTDFGQIAETRMGYASTAALKLADIGAAESSISSFLNLNLDGLASKAAAFCSGMNAFIGGGLDEFTKSFADGVMNAVQAAAGLSAIGDRSEGIENFSKIDFTGFKANVENFTDAMKSLSGSVTTFTDKDLGYVINAEKAFTTIQDMANSAQTVGVTTDLSRFESLTKMLTERISAFAADCKEANKGSGDINDALKIVDAIAQAINQSAAKFQPELVQSMTDALRDLITVIRSMESINSTNVNAFVDSLKFIGSDGIQTFINELNGGIEPAIRAVAILMYAINQAVQDNTPTIIDTVVDFSGKVVSNMKDTLESNVSTGKMKAAGQTLINAVAVGLRMGNKQEIINAVITLGSTIAEYVNHGWGAVYEAGKHLMEGLALGIRANAHLATNAATEVTNKVKSTVSSGVEAHSPSRFGIRIGKYIDQGLGLGLLKYSDAVTGAAGQVTDDALDTMTKSLNNIGSIVNEDLESVPVITPVIDTSMVQSGISDINSMFAQQQALKVANAAVDVEASNLGSNIEELIDLTKSMLTAIKSGGDIYLNENLIVGRINRRLGAI